jgi:hypothetical protein
MGISAAPDLRIDVDQVGSEEEKFWFKAVIDYHHANVGSLYLLTGHVYLSMNLREFVRHGIKMPSAQLIGEMATGKSTLAQDVQAMFPSKYAERSLIKEKDRKMSASLLSQESAKVRPPNVQDPPTADKQSLESFIDDSYEGKLSINKKNF